MGMAKQPFLKACVATAALCFVGFATGAAQARDVRCTIYEYRAVALDAPCNFEPDGRDGSFTLSSRSAGAALLKDVMMISITMISPGVAEVRGLTRAGINSRWGEARRSTQDRSCWTGSDFQICARSP
jgi:hypothetical protein